MSAYLGRIVAAARTPDGRPAALYRVSSRSFPDRRAAVAPDGRAVAIAPMPGHEADVLKNPYIAYNCARLVGRRAALSNGGHTDPIAEKLAAGLPPRDALALVLHALDYEHDGHDTPRIAVVSDLDDPAAAWLGTVRADGLCVERFELAPGECVHLSTYGRDRPGPDSRLSGFDAGDAMDACAWALGERGGAFADFSHPVTAVCAMAGPGGFALAARAAAE